MRRAAEMIRGRMLPTAFGMGRQRAFVSGPTAASSRQVEVNGRRYNWPDRPLVVVCVDGSEPDYMEQAMSAGRMPWLERTLESGTRRIVDSVIPSFTNPNNLSIVTGSPPAVHGICGNYFYNPELDEEVMMNDPSLLWADTIFAAFQRDAGARIAVVTAKDKLRRLLGHGLNIGTPSKGGAVCFSAEKADEATLETHGIERVLERVGLPLPSVYSPELSELVLAAGVDIMERDDRPDIMYLSTTDYIQHKHAPGTEEANRFYAMMDSYWARLDALGVTLGLTADHGMTPMHDAKGRPNVIYLQSLMDEWLGTSEARVILPITDPYVVHHGALGGFATVYLRDASRHAEMVLERLSGMDGIDCALSRGEACERFELPPDRVGDVVVIAKEEIALGSAQEHHDLSGLDEPLRSHGSLSEQKVPFYLNRPTPGLVPGRRLRNFDIFEVALNDVSAT